MQDFVACLRRFRRRANNDALFYIEPAALFFTEPVIQFKKGNIFLFIFSCKFVVFTVQKI